MKLRVTMSQQPMIPPLRGDKYLPVKEIPENRRYVMDYDLTRGCSTTNKFISLMKKTQSYGEWSTSWNFYPTIDRKRFIQMKNRMNWLIEKMKTVSIVNNVDPKLVLDVNSFDAEVDKLNALHEYFEDESNQLSDNEVLEYIEHGDIYVWLEEINQLVHSMEGLEFDINYEPDLEFFGTCRVVARGDAEGAVQMQPLTDIDYKNFTVYHNWGDLTLDYFRVGKDLMACYASNDLPLVRTKKLSQQNTVHTCFEMRFKKWGKEGEPYYPVDGLAKWIKDNNLDQYYDFSKPEFTSGRVKLGQLNMEGKTKDGVMSELMKCTGIYHIELLDG